MLYFALIVDKYNFHIKKVRYLLSVLLFSYVFFLSGFSFAKETSVEYKIKAGYLYNFTKFITWSENDLVTFNLCIFGEDPFGSIIDPIEKRFVRSKPIRLFRVNSINELQHCQLIYFSSAASENELSLLSKSILMINISASTLTVGESTAFIESGGMIAFSLEQGKVRLKINLKTLRANGLGISAKLLEVADIYAGASND